MVFFLCCEISHSLLSYKEFITCVLLELLTIKLAAHWKEKIGLQNGEIILVTWFLEALMKIIWRILLILMRKIMLDYKHMENKCITFCSKQFSLIPVIFSLFEVNISRPRLFPTKALTVLTSPFFQAELSFWQYVPSSYHEIDNQIFMIIKMRRNKH